MLLLKKLINLTSTFGYYHFANIAALKPYLSVISFKNKTKFSKLDKTIVITGFPRSGTTWLVELYQKKYDPFYIHEPLFKGRTGQWDALNLSWEQFFPDDFTDEKIEGIMKSILSGVILNPALVQHNNLGNINRKEWLMVKFVRGNLLLPWLTTRFSFEIKPVYIVRHPCAVINSMLKHQAWGYHEQITFPVKWHQEKSLFSDRFQSITNALPVIRTVEELFALQWCLNTYPIYHKKNNLDWHTISYEHLTQGDRETINKIGLSNLNEDEFNKSSFSALDYNQNTKKQISKWKHELSKEQIEHIFQILEIFDIQLYQPDHEIPDISILLSNVNKNRLFQSLSVNT